MTNRKLRHTLRRAPLLIAMTGILAGCSVFRTQSASVTTDDKNTAAELAATPATLRTTRDWRATARPASLAPCAANGGIGAGCYDNTSRHTSSADTALDVIETIDAERAARFRPSDAR
ncbi:MAG: hypothetical protein AAF224_09245 [Pseudomonadota bacterium]